MQIYFVRHAQPMSGAFPDALRPLSPEGLRDSRRVAETLRDVPLDFCTGSPYRRSCETIAACALEHGLTCLPDARFREREAGCNTPELMKRRWADFSWHEQGGEALCSVQNRNIEALFQILDRNDAHNVLLGTHGTALSVIRNYFEPSFCFDGFWRSIDFMPYILRMEFHGRALVEWEELLIVKKKYRG